MRGYRRPRGAPLALVLLLATASGCAPLFRRGAEPAPASFVPSTAELRATRLIQVRDGLARADALRVVTETLQQRYVVDVTDAAAGFLMTAWRAPISRGGVPDLRYRTRFIVRFGIDDWHRVQLRSEANWARGGDEWDVGYDVAQLDTMTAELRARLGRRP